MASPPHDPDVRRPISPSSRPTSLPQAYPALKLMAEKTRTTPAEIIQVINVGLISISSSYPALGVALRVFFVSRSLLCSRAFRFDGLDRGVNVGESGLACGLGPLSPRKCDSDTRRRVVGSAGRDVLGIVFIALSSFGFAEPRTAAAHDSSVVKDARNAAS